jgi:hypothetical protein
VKPTTAGSAAGRVVGVDAAGGYGWVGVVINDDGFERARPGTLSEILAWAEPIDVLGADIPIGHVNPSRPHSAGAAANNTTTESSTVPSPAANLIEHMYPS